MDDIAARLEAEYCPPIDTSTFFAILSDFDLTIESDIQTARETLDPLKEFAVVEEALGFDASGTGAQDGCLESTTRPESCPDTTSASASRETDMTSLSNGMWSLDTGHEESSPTTGDKVTAEDIENQSDEKKIELLLQVLQGRVSRFNAQYTLQKCHGRWHKAMDELLSQVFLNEDGQEEGAKVPKGIDAFSEDNVIRRGRKKKPKGKNLNLLDERRSSSLPVSPIDSPAPTTNRWHTASQDVEFIATRTGYSVPTVRSIYNDNGLSLPKAIAGVLKDSIQNGKANLEDDPILAVNAHDLGIEFPAIAEVYVRAVIRLTHPSTAAAHELAKALTAESKAAIGGIQIIPTYAKPLEEEEELPSPASRNNTPAVLMNLPESSTAAERAAAYSAARSAALSQAYAAHRTAKSNRLMGGAAAYYGQIGREYAMLSSQASASAADELADSQSASSQLDLHGIDVLNGVRIAREKVGQWWEGLGENRANGRLGAEERQAGYTIIVGLGRHSEGGKSKLGPAVIKGLKEDGWKVEQAGAVLMVKGRARK